MRRALWLKRPSAEAYDGFGRGDTTQIMLPRQGRRYHDAVSTFGAYNGISAGQFASVGVAGQIAAIDTGFSDGRIAATLAVASNGSRLVCRLSDIPNGGGSNFIYVNASGTNWTLNRRVFGSVTALATYSTAPANGDVVLFTFYGPLLEVTINGTSRLTATDGWNMGATRHGLVNGTTSGRWDDLAITRLN